jgi:hypothetical protein
VHRVLDLDQISRLLKDRKLDAVSDETGLHRNIIAGIRDRKNQNPAYATVKRLSDYLEANP